MLVLDNFEQVRAAATAVAAILATCPQVKVLVTSRVPLHLTGEYEFAVPPLEVPERAATSLESLATIPSVILFAQRARAVRAEFLLSDSNAVAVTDICRRLDGLPLAIELAAARSKVLSPTALLARLTHGLEVLSGGPLDQPERLQTLRAAITWSYDLLSPDEQALFARVSTFTGGFSLDDAEVVARPDALTAGSLSGPESVFDSLAALVDSSLLHSGDGIDGEPRFTMLETIREFALECLQQRGELDRMRRRHASYFLDVAEQAEPEMYGSQNQARLLEHIQTNHDNFRAALGWAVETRNADIALRLSGALFFFWYIRGHMTEGRRWLARALALDSGAPTSARAHALIGSGFLANWQGDFDAAVTFLEQGLDLARRVPDQRLMIFALGLLGTAFEDAGDYDRAARLLQEALERNQMDGKPIFNPTLIGQVVTHSGIVAWGQGDVDRAVEIWTDSLIDQRARQDPWGAANSLRYLAMVACERNELREAAQLQAESLMLYWQARAIDDLADGFSITAAIATRRGAFIPAARLLGAAEVLRDDIGSRPALPERVLFERCESSVRQALAGPVLDAAWSAGRSLPLDMAVAEALSLLEGETAEPAPDPPHGLELTARELDVLRLLVLGRTDREIADALFISPRTAQGHVARLFDKLGVNTRTAAVAAALQAGLLED